MVATPCRTRNSALGAPRNGPRQNVYTNHPVLAAAREDANTASAEATVTNTRALEAECAELSRAIVSGVPADNQNMLAKAALKADQLKQSFSRADRGMSWEWPLSAAQTRDRAHQCEGRTLLADHAQLSRD